MWRSLVIELLVCFVGGRNKQAEEDGRFMVSAMCFAADVLPARH